MGFSFGMRSTFSQGFAAALFVRRARVEGDEVASQTTFFADRAVRQGRAEGRQVQGARVLRRDGVPVGFGLGQINGRGPHAEGRLHRSAFVHFIYGFGGAFARGDVGVVLEAAASGQPAERVGLGPRRRQVAGELPELVLRDGEVVDPIHTGGAARRAQRRAEVGDLLLARLRDRGGHQRGSNDGGDGDGAAAAHGLFGEEAGVLHERRVGLVVGGAVVGLHGFGGSRGFGAAGGRLRRDTMPQTR